jgi:hypothetical protein
MKFKHCKFGILAIAMVILTNWMPLLDDLSHSFGIATMPPATAVSSVAADSTMAGVKAAKRGSNIKLNYAGNNFTFASNGIPNHSRPAEYALPTPGVGVLNASTAYVGADPTQAQPYNFTYVLLNTKDSTSSIRCFTGTAKITMRMLGMQGRPRMPPPPPGGPGRPPGPGLPFRE